MHIGPAAVGITGVGGDAPSDWSLCNESSSTWFVGSDGGEVATAEFQDVLIKDSARRLGEGAPDTVLMSILFMFRYAGNIALLIKLVTAERRSFVGSVGEADVMDILSQKSGGSEGFWKESGVAVVFVQKRKRGGCLIRAGEGENRMKRAWRCGRSRWNGRSSRGAVIVGTEHVCRRERPAFALVRFGLVDGDGELVYGGESRSLE